MVYVEEGITEFLDLVFLCFQRELVKQRNKQINDVICKTLGYLGRFCDYEGLTNLVYPTSGLIDSKWPFIIFFRHIRPPLCISK